MVGAVVVVVVATGPPLDRVKLAAPSIPAFKSVTKVSLCEEDGNGIKIGSIPVKFKDRSVFSLLKTSPTQLTSASFTTTVLVDPLSCISIVK